LIDSSYNGCSIAQIVEKEKVPASAAQMVCNKQLQTYSFIQQVFKQTYLNKSSQP